jgi:hypothetical protein
MEENFGAAVAASTTRPVVMAAAAADRAKIFQNQPLTTSIETPRAEKTFDHSMHKTLIHAMVGINERRAAL